MNKQKGFTIIELIVVIAIIAVLAGIVLINVSGYIKKSKDASIQGNMHTIQTAMIAANYQNSGTWTALGTSSADYTQAVSGIAANGGTFTPLSASGAWCATSTMPSGATAWCVDSTGYAGTLGASKCTGTTYTCQ